MSELCIREKHEGICACIDGESRLCLNRETCPDYEPQKPAPEKRIDVLEAALRKLITVSRSEWVSGEWVAKVAEEALKGGE